MREPVSRRGFVEGHRVLETAMDVVQEESFSRDLAERLMFLWWVVVAQSVLYWLNNAQVHNVQKACLSSP
jgi:hypothetical protein